jgi:hypothetical protein
MRAGAEANLHRLGLYPADKPLSMDAYIMARNISSEAGSGTGAEKLAIGEVLVNRARAKGISFEKIALWNGTHFAAQIGNNPAVATARDPYWEDFVAAELVLSGESRNLTKGATHYFSPRTQDNIYRKGKDAKDRFEVYRRWTGWPAAWVGYVPGIDVERQMFFRVLDLPSEQAFFDEMYPLGKQALLAKVTPSEVMAPIACAMPMDKTPIWLAAGVLALGAGAYYFLRYKA